MDFTPRTVDEVYDQWLAHWLARSPATDVTEGSVVSILGRVTADIFAGAERDIWRVREAFDFRNARGEDLDRRLLDLPPSFQARIGATVGTGGAVQLTREDDGVLAEWTLNAGATFCRSTDRVVYETIVDLTWPAGQTQISLVALRCRVPGSSGNCRATQIDKVFQASNGTGRVVSVINTLPISNALDEETDTQLIARALLFLSGLTSNTKQALEYLGSTFVASDGSVAKQARVFEDLDRPYVELMIDDGSALAGSQRPGVGIEGVIPEGGPGPVYIYHESPAISEINTIRINGDLLDPVHYKSYPEQGRVVLLETAPIEIGDTWQISKYNVWSGLPRELQEEINDNRKPSGVRVRVVAPLFHWVNFDLNVLPVDGSDFDEVVKGARDIAVNFIAGLSPGEPLFISRLVTAIHGSELIKTVRVLAPGTGSIAADVTPTSLRHVIRSSLERIRVVPLPLPE